MEYPISVISIDAYAFASCSSLTIHCEATSEPNSWNSLWNENVYGWGTPPSVVWGYTEE